MSQNDSALIKSNVGKMHRIFLIIASIISLVELVLLIRGFCIFNLERLKLRLYLYSYIFLFISSVFATAFSIIYRKWEKHWKKLSVMTNIYATCLVFWSSVVTCIDCYANGDSGVIVYVMTCISVGVLILMKPWYFVSLLCTTGTLMLISIYFAKGEQFYSSGFYINFIVFMALAIFINAHNYKLSTREYETRQLLRKLSYTDQLTSVYNRRRLDKNIAEMTLAKKSFVFILMDIDNFKKVNDEHGHAVGDRCLVLLAKKLTEKFGDGVYRFGGDEFAIITQMSEAAACSSIDAINNDPSFSFDDIKLHISAGIYTKQENDSSGSVFIKTDRALYEAKAKGKANWTLYKK